MQDLMAALDGTPWSHDEPARAGHPQMLRCSEPGYNTPVTHDDGTHLDPYLCCPCHCTCYDISSNRTCYYFGFVESVQS